MSSVILLIDVSSLVYRAYYALPEMKAKSGQMTNAIYGFINMFWMVIGQIEPYAVIACMDSKEKTVRKEMFDEYKAQRVAMPEEFYSQLPLVEKFLACLTVPVVKVPGYEADDLIASCIRKINPQHTFYILTSDKDLAQLVRDNVYLCNYFRGKIDCWDREKVKSKFGVYPEQFVDYLSLVGDSSDNIPGVPSIGPKTASSLLNKYGDLETIYQNLDCIPTRTKENLIKFREVVFRNRSLIRVIDSVNIDFRLTPLSKELPDCLYEFYQDLGFRSFIKRQFPHRLDDGTLF